MADIPVWPATLPTPSPDGYGITPVTAFSRTSMDNGRARQRRRFTSTPSYLSVAWTFSQEQFGLFEGFLAHEIGLGTCWFQTRMLNGMGVTSVQARFMDDPPYRVATVGSSTNWFQVTATLEVKALPVVTRDEYDVLIAYTAAEIAAMGDPLHELIHVDLPGPMRWD